MGANMKSARDAVIPGGVALFVAGILEHAGLDPYYASAVGVVAAWAVARAYRIVRRRWPWLAAADPGAEQLMNIPVGIPGPPLTATPTAGQGGGTQRPPTQP